MPLLRTGRDRIAGLITGAETCHWGTSSATIWVASSTAAHDPASTWLGSQTTPTYAATMESGYPARSGNILQFRGIYSTAYANFQWEQWLIHTASASGSGASLNVAPQQALGTKTSAQSWQLTACVTITTTLMLALGLAQMLGLA